MKPLANHSPRCISFGAAAFLFCISVFSLKEAPGWYHVPFAAVPLVFALHQGCEGLIWTVLAGQFGTPTFQPPWPLLYFYFLLAFCLWPAYVPWALYMLEKAQNEPEANEPHLVTRILARWRLTLMKGTCIIGLLLSVVTLVPAMIDGVQVKSVQNHLEYDYMPYNQGTNDARLLVYLGWPGVIVLFFCYFVAIGLPFVLSSVRFMWLVGSVVVVAGIGSLLYSTYYFFSVWCFFAALLSCLNYFLIIRPAAVAAAKRVEPPPLPL